MGSYKNNVMYQGFSLKAVLAVLSRPNIAKHSEIEATRLVYLYKAVLV